MSRSYRKPWYVDGYGSRYKKLSKRFANKAIRRAKEVSDGKMYRKFYNPWDICDYKFPWDPRPYISMISGEPIIVLPDPRWKAWRK